MNAKNLIGQRFGRLVVVSEAPRQESAPKQKWYHCKCDCGNEVDVCTYQLTSGNVKSCGCLQREKRFRDITGERRGHLTAIRPTGEVRDGSAVWVWRCDCGNEIEALARNIGPDGRTSCGCKRQPLNVQQAADMRKANEHNLVDNTNLALISSDTMYKSNTSGVRGVSWHKGTQKWLARITVQGKTIGLGYYSKLGDAKKAREKAEREYFQPLIEKHAED